jgi:hypothetical protein
MLSCRQRLSTASMYLLDMVKDYISYQDPRFD